MARKTDHFLGEMLAALRKRLPGEWRLEAGPSWRVLRIEDWGYSGVGPAMTFKHLPATSVFLDYGVTHNSLEPILRQLAEAAGNPLLDTYQFSQTTENFPLEPGCKSLQVEDYNDANFDAAAQSLLGPQGIERLLNLFERFSNLREVRRALEERDGTLMTLGAPNNMVAIDLVLDDLEHLRRFRENCKPRHFAVMIDKALERLGVTL